jgi:hypothetical protein
MPRIKKFPFRIPKIGFPTYSKQLLGNKQFIRWQVNTRSSFNLSSTYIKKIYLLSFPQASNESFDPQK